MDENNVTARELLALGKTLPQWAHIGAAALLADVLLIVAYGSNRLATRVDPEWIWFPRFLANGVWSSGDGSFMEVFGLSQLVAASVLLIRSFIAEKSDLVLAVWGFCLLIVVADDGFQLHEQVGWFLGVNVLQLSGGAAQEIGGLALWISVGLACTIAIGGAHWVSSLNARQWSRSLTVVILPLAFIGMMYVAILSVRPDVLQGFTGELIIWMRITTKLFTMTAFLVLAMCLVNERRSDGCAPDKQST